MLDVEVVREADAQRIEGDGRVGSLGEDDLRTRPHGEDAEVASVGSTMIDAIIFIEGGPEIEGDARSLLT